MKIWQKYLLEQRKKALQAKASKRVSTTSLKNIEVLKQRKNTLLARTITKEEVDQLTIKDFE